MATWLNLPLANNITFSIQYIAYDTRLIDTDDAPHTLFFALKTPHNDGENYISDAVLKGVRFFYTSVSIGNKEEKCGIFIENYPINATETVPITKIKTQLSALKAMQKIAIGYRNQFEHLKTIAITGSNGKTIVKEWLAQAIGGDEQIVRSPKSFNSQLGVPMSIFEIEKQHSLGIFEAGISETGEMRVLEQIIQPKIGIFTNVLTAHDDGFTSKQAKANEKVLLFVNTDVIIYNKDNIYCENAVKTLNTALFSWSRNRETANLFIAKEEQSGIFTKITAIYKEQEKYIELPFLDAASIENAITVWATMLYLGYGQGVIRERLYRLESLAARLEIKAAINNCTLINDSYSLDLDSLRIALSFMERQDVYNKKTLITSILDSRKEENLQGVANDWFQKAGRLLKGKGIKKVIIVGRGGEELKPFLAKETLFFSFETTDDLLNNLPTLSLENESILLKGARKFAFERVAERISQRAHKTLLEVNLDALKHNFRQYKMLIAPTTKLMVMVKAHAYGSGAYQVAKLLEHQKADYLAVAYVDEGYDLRQNGIKLPIMVMNVEESAFDALIRYDLAPEIYSLNVLKGFATAIRRFHALQNTAIADYSIHIKLDTGMKRLGFEEEDIDDLCQLLEKNPNLKVLSVFSHLVATDNPEHDDFTHTQVARFLKMYAKVSEKIGYKPLRHILNTSGISRFSNEYQLDMVRLGIGLYGVDSEPKIQAKLETVLTLKATISQVKHIAAGETIGYNRVGKAERDLRIGTVSIGYADGISRRLSNRRGAFLVENQLAYIVGNVCMDMCMIDITDIPLAKEGSDVIIFGKNRPVQDLAKQVETIAYELFTDVSSRVKRVYFSE